MALVTKTYTTTSDFNEGAFDHTNATAVADQVQLDSGVAQAPLKYVVLPLSDSIVRLDAATGAVLGQFFTAPIGFSRTPYAIAVDSLGNVWAANFSEASVNGISAMGSVVKIGILVGGTRCDSDTTPNPVGQYVQGPFSYSTAIDRNADGLIFTSRGLSDARNWPNVTDGSGGGSGVTAALVEDATDECILIYQRTDPKLAACIAVDASDNVWVGGYANGTTTIQPFDKLSGADGSKLFTLAGGASSSSVAGGRTGFISAGILFSTDGSGPSARLLRYDIGANTSTTLLFSVSDPARWCCEGTGGFFYALSTPQGTLHKRSMSLGMASAGGNFPVSTGALTSVSGGLCVTPVSGDVWMSSGTANAVKRYTSLGVLVATIPVTAPDCMGVDTNGKVWVLSKTYPPTAVRIDPGTNLPDLSVALAGPSSALGAGPLLSGTVPLATLNPDGTWTVIYDAGVPVNWATIDWDETTPASTSLSVQWKVAASKGGLLAAIYTTALDSTGSSMAPAVGQFVEILVTFDRDSATVSATPTLPRLRISGTTSGVVIISPSDQQRQNAVSGVNSENPALPNIILVCPQGLGCDQLSRLGLGSTYAHTPFLNQLMDAGVRYTNGYCLPNAQATLAALLTGQYPLHSGVAMPPRAGLQPLLNSSISFADQLRAQSTLVSRFGFFGDYTVATHEAAREAGPLALGFDHFYGRVDAVDEQNDWPRSSGEHIDAFEVEDLVMRCATWIGQQAPCWTAVLAPRIPDYPLCVPPGSGLAPDFSDLPAAYYRAALELLDRELFALYKTLRQSVRSNVLWVFWPLSTTPATILDSPYDTAHGPGTMYEQGVNVPVIVSGSGVTLGGRVSTDLVAPYDLWRTLLDLTGILSQPFDPAESLSFYPSFATRTGHTTRTSLFLEQWSPNGAHLGATRAGVRSIRGSQYKLLRTTTGFSFPDAGVEFYDLLADPRETTNLTPGGDTSGLTVGQVVAYVNLRTLYASTVNT